MNGEMDGVDGVADDGEVDGVANGGVNGLASSAEEGVAGRGVTSQFF